jgi:hypothetical protein
MTEIKHHTNRANDIRQHYVESGEGAPVVLLHGFPETSYAWRYQIPELAKKYRVIAPDLRGYGETDKPATGYDKRNMAKDLRELMRSLEILCMSKLATVTTTLFAVSPDRPDNGWRSENLAPDRLVAITRCLHSPTRNGPRDRRGQQLRHRAFRRQARQGHGGRRSCLSRLSRIIGSSRMMRTWLVQTETS